MPKFHMRDTFELARNLFILAGTMLEGEIQPGMFVRIPVIQRRHHRPDSPHRNGPTSG